LLPGPYMVVADARSIEPEGIDAAKWSFIYLGSNNRLATDRINQMFMNTYGHQRIVTDANDQVDIAPLFYSEQFDSVDNAILQQGRIHYVIVDTRLSTALPLENTYFENDMPHRIIRANALEKFAAAHINRLFDSGNIIIYGTGALIHESTP